MQDRLLREKEEQQEREREQKKLVMEEKIREWLKTKRERVSICVFTGQKIVVKNCIATKLCKRPDKIEYFKNLFCHKERQEQLVKQRQETEEMQRQQEKQREIECKSQQKYRDWLQKKNQEKLEKEKKEKVIFLILILLS